MHLKEVNTVPSSNKEATAFTRKPHKPALKSELLSTELAERIVAGQLSAGTLLASENELGTMYSISRPHVRQGLQRLASAGLIETRHGLGSYVNHKERWNLFDPLLLNAFINSGNLAAISTELVELRKMVEIECAGLAATRLSDTELKELAGFLKRMDLTLDDATKMAKMDIMFHNVIVRAGRNRFLQGIMVYLDEPLSRARLLTMQAGELKGRTRAQSHHQAIFLALQNRDAEAAREAMEIHMRQLEADMKQALVLI